MNNLPKVVMLPDFVPVGIEPTTYWSQVQRLTDTPLRHLWEVEYRKKHILVVVSVHAYSRYIPVMGNTAYK